MKKIFNYQRRMLKLYVTCFICCIIAMTNSGCTKKEEETSYTSSSDGIKSIIDNETEKVTNKLEKQIYNIATFKAERESRAVIEAKRLLDEKAEREEAERLAAEQAAREEAERIAAEQAAQEEAERIAAEQAAIEQAAAEQQQAESQSYGWDGQVLTAWLGVVQGPSGKETYYNLDMSGVIDIMRGIGNYDEYWVRSDGVKMLGNYVMVAADLSIRPRGSLVETSLGTGIVCDTGTFIYSDPYQIDIAVTW